MFKGYCLIAVIVSGLAPLAHVHAAQIADDDASSIMDFAVCQSNITDAQEVLRLPDPVIRCGGLAGRVVEQSATEWHASGHRHDGRRFNSRHRYACNYFTTESGYRGSCRWEQQNLVVPLLKPLPIPTIKLPPPKRP